MNIKILGIVLLVSGCAAAPPPAMISAPTATEADIPRARAALKSNLKDAQSARFLGEVLKPGAVCGIVNSKNSYGGYVGDTPYLFIVATGEVYTLEYTGNQTNDRAMIAKFEQYCRT